MDAGGHGFGNGNGRNSAYGNGNGHVNGHANSDRVAPRPDRALKRFGPMTNRYIYDTSGIADRLSGYQPPPPSVSEREAAKRRELERLEAIIYQR